jgi:hypothetical protein
VQPVGTDGAGRDVDVVHHEHELSRRRGDEGEAHPLTAFSPSNPSGHYLGDAGLSTGLDGCVVTFSFLAPPSGTFLLKVSDVLIPGPGTGPYPLQVAGATTP